MLSLSQTELIAPHGSFNSQGYDKSSILEARLPRTYLLVTSEKGLERRPKLPFRCLPAARQGFLTLFIDSKGLSLGFTGTF